MASRSTNVPPDWSRLDNAVNRLYGLLPHLLHTQTSPAAHRLLEQWHDPYDTPQGTRYLDAVVEASLHPAITHTARDLRHGLEELSNRPHSTELADQLDQTAAAVTAELERMRVEAAIRRTGMRLGEVIDTHLPAGAASLAVTWRDQSHREAWSATLGTPGQQAPSWVLEVVPARDRSNIDDVLEYLRQAREALQNPYRWGDVRSAVREADHLLKGRGSAQAPSPEEPTAGDLTVPAAGDLRAEATPGTAPGHGSTPELG